MSASTWERKSCVACATDGARPVASILLPEAGSRHSAREVDNAAMAPGVNAYLFAHMYGVAKRVNASAVLIATALSILTTWAWLTILP